MGTEHQPALGESEETEVNIVAIIEARMASSRLPGKVMLPILGKPTLQLMVNRVLKSKYINSAMIRGEKHGIISLTHLFIQSLQQPF